MSVTTVLAQLALLQAQITGVKVAYAEAPNSVVAANMPLFITIPGEAEDDWVSAGSDSDLETRTYRMLLIVAPRGAGIPGEALALCNPFFDRVRDFFAARPALGLDSVHSATYLGDSGTTNIVYQDVPQVGIEFRLRIVEYLQRTYAVGE